MKQYLRSISVLLCIVLLAGLMIGLAVFAEDELPIIPVNPDPKPTTEPTEPSTEPTESTTEAPEPSTEPTEPTTEPTEPTTAEPEPTTPNNPFTDVLPGSYYYEAVLWAVDRSITNGMTATTFVPSNPCTRAQVVTFLWRAKGSQTPKTTKTNFTDLETGRFYYQAVLWAVENGVTNGMTATTFCPENPCTRGQVVTFLWRALGKPSATPSGDPDELPVVSASDFVDLRPGAFYEQAVVWAVSAGVTQGMSPNTFGPELTCTRAHVVTFLHRAFGN